MGAGASTITTIQNEYNFSGNNNGITSGDQGVYGTTTGASTDVKPTADMNYSPQINPDFGNYLHLLGIGNRAKLTGVVSKTSNVIDSVRHIGAAAYRVAMGDDGLIDKARDLIGLVTKIDDSSAVLNGNETMAIDVIRNTSDLQLEVVKRMPDAHDAYGALALGMTGMRNSELNTRPTQLSLNGCYERASEGEKLNAKNIVELAGPRMGVIPRSSNIMSSTVIQETLDNTITEHGTVGDLKRDAEKMVNIQRDMKCSVLHATSFQLSEAGVLPTDSWETTEIIGMVKQHSVPLIKAKVFPGGYVLNTKDSHKAVQPYPTDDGGVEYIGICPTAQAYELPNLENVSRDTYIILNGRITINNQPWPGDDTKHALHVGLVYFDSEKNKKFTPAYFINTKEYVAKSNTISNVFEAAERKNYKYTPLSRFKSHERQVMKGSHPVEIKGVGYDASKMLNDGTKADPTPAVEADYFTIDSAFQIVANLSKMKELYADQVYETDIHYVGPFKAMLVLAMTSNLNDKSIEVMLSVASPIVRIETVSNPLYMMYMGNRYIGTIVDLIGMVPEWYTTGDHHDPVYLYKQFLIPFLPYLAKIADNHVQNEGAALELSREHVIRAYNRSGGKEIFSLDDKVALDAQIRKIIVKMHEALYVTGPFGPLIAGDKKIILMHFLEKVINQSLTHISVWRDRTVAIKDSYARECKDYNAIELEMDKKRVVNPC